MGSSHEISALRIGHRGHLPTLLDFIVFIIRMSTPATITSNSILCLQPTVSRCAESSREPEAWIAGTLIPRT